MDEENVFPKGQSYSIDNDAMTRLQRPDMQFRSRYVHCQQFSFFYKTLSSRNRHTQVLSSTWVYLTECTGNRFLFLLRSGAVSKRGL